MEFCESHLGSTAVLMLCSTMYVHMYIMILHACIYRFIHNDYMSVAVYIILSDVTCISTMRLLHSHTHTHSHTRTHPHTHTHTHVHTYTRTSHHSTSHHIKNSTTNNICTVPLMASSYTCTYVYHSIVYHYTTLHHRRYNCIYLCIC